MPRDLASLKTVLANSRLQKDNNPAYQVILGLIDNLEATDRIVTSITSSSGGGSGPSPSTPNDPMPQIMLLGLPGKRSLPESTGGGSSDPFIGSMILGGM